MSPEQQLKRWQEDIKKAWNDIVWRSADRKIYKRLGEISEENRIIKNEANLLVGWMVRNYVVGIAAGIRRQVDLDKRSTSLLNIILGIENSPTVLTRTIYRDICKSIGGDQSDADQHFDLFAPGGKEDVDPAQVHADVDRLVGACKPIKKLVNKTLAHLDRKGLKVIPTYKELDDALDVIGELGIKYYRLLTGYGTTTDAIQESWEHLLTIPWIEDEVVADRVRKMHELILVVDLHECVLDELKNHWWSKALKGRGKRDDEKTSLLWEGAIRYVHEILVPPGKQMYVFQPSKDTPPEPYRGWVKDDRKFLKKSDDEMNGLLAEGVVDRIVEINPTRIHVVGAYAEHCVFETARALAEKFGSKRVVVHAPGTIPQQIMPEELKATIEKYDREGILIDGDLMMWALGKGEIITS